MRLSKTPEVRAQLIQCAALYRTAHERMEGIIPRPPEEAEDWGIDQALQAERMAFGLLELLPAKSRSMLERALNALEEEKADLEYMANVCSSLAQS